MGPFRFCRFPGSGCWILALSLLSKFSELTTKRTGLSIALHPGQDFSGVVRSVGCRVSRVASLPSTPDTYTVGLKEDIREGSADI